ncbi:MAG TPA: CvpA family protein [Bryobacteraceae bacterium]|jgi:membrane protein required for colicin V production|nr:CvpA family protein [Bryobacteraceae bacterium]
MNWFDVALLVLIVASVLSGLRTGLARVVMHLVATIAGLVAGFWFYGIAADELMPWVHDPVAARIAGFALIFIGVMIAGALAGWLIARLFRLIGLGWLDHLLGGAAGLLRGAVIVAAIVAVIVAFSPGTPPAFLAESQVAPYATRISSVLAQFAPRELRQGFEQQIEKLKRRWASPASNDKRIV